MIVKGFVLNLHNISKHKKHPQKMLFVFKFECKFISSYSSAILVVGVAYPLNAA